MYVIFIKKINTLPQDLIGWTAIQTYGQDVVSLCYSIKQDWKAVIRNKVSLYIFPHAF
jgi:hypothetical protein